MKKISQEDLIGYVLGALDASEEQTIASALEQDLTLRERLAEVEDKLSNLPDRFVEIDPPAGLLDKTLNTISIVDTTFGNEDDSHSLSKPTDTVRLPSRMSADSETGVKKSNWSLIDLVVSCSVCLVFASILLPSIASSRFQSDMLFCQNNLRTIGYNLASIADSYDGKLEVVRHNDQIDVGQYVKMMIDAELAAESSGMICPSDPLKEQTQSEYEAAWFRSVSHIASESVELVTPEMELATSTVGRNHSSDLQTYPCGSYSFAVPARKKNSKQLVKVSVPCSTDQVLAGDAPCSERPGFQSLNHGAKGQNVLYGDLSVSYINDSAYLPSGDHIYLNNQGEVQPGFSLKDNLLATGTIICNGGE